MKCLICNRDMSYYFTKDFTSYNLKELQNCVYYICENCGMVVSKTHFDMSDTEWENLNFNYHSSFLIDGGISPEDPNWLERLDKQVNFLEYLYVNEILPKNNWLDWGCGNGILSDKLKERGILLQKYDKYFNSIELKCKNYDFIITTSVFEHIREYSTLKSIADLLTERGIMGLHTLICERIPKDPKWFYLLPVHCTFFTNKSTSILMENLGFKYSAYNINSRLWFMSKYPIKSNVNLITKEGFVDYWK